MKIRFYLDEHVSRAVTVGLRRRGLDVLTVQEELIAGVTSTEELMNQVLFLPL